MIKQTQLITKGKNSDCFRACVASIFELDINKLPAPPLNTMVQDWANFFGKFGIRQVISHPSQTRYGGYWIGTYKGHALVFNQTKMVFDPWPDGQYDIEDDDVFQGMSFDIVDPAKIFGLNKFRLDPKLGGSDG